jgi:hypothetical protein
MAMNAKTPDISIQTMDAEKIIAEIELLEHIVRLPDKRPLRMTKYMRIIRGSGCGSGTA